nr:immunoglobulin light chain junction region [Macaca mulatta]MOX91059.1 immunoglobulin light chain junction region [Macaca mulatta]
CMQPLEYPLTF